ncbi:Fe-S oxidoreductase [Patiriisocius marinistellae]|uniref:Fe-S oxidoreductase n=1 Tax=Patiriisocius marinistellae TaxID=2494560 RepID=A0A5J4G138_9FLAO|nr:YkgJ family cysteine cluster protein [Patiriisocius marinistellae]GEQ87332.1 Fe-S oxidoreductase [Patiriisocius marinistellae]
MEETLRELPKKAKDKHNEHKKYFAKLKKKPPKNLDKIMVELHDAEFEKTDCLACANCCKTTSPIFTTKDINRIAKHFRIKEQRFIETYLSVDEDNFHVLKSAPCTFLADDNSCSIYDVRPKACAEYPHTDRRDFHKISEITLKNTAICPATFNIVEAMKKAVDVGKNPRGEKHRFNGGRH